MTGAQVGLISKNADGLSYGYTRADDVVVVLMFSSRSLRMSVMMLEMMANDMQMRSERREIIRRN